MNVSIAKVAGRVVGYWCGEDPLEAARCAADYPQARRFYDREVMVRLYGPPTELSRQPRWEGS